jgi:hypothetical protein
MMGPAFEQVLSHIRARARSAEASCFTIVQGMFRVSLSGFHILLKPVRYAEERLG